MDTISRRTFAKAAIGGGLAAVLARSSSSAAIRPGPSTSTEITPTIEWFMRDLFQEVSEGDLTKVDPRAQIGLPEEPITANIIAVASVTVDLNGEVNAYVVYEGLHREGQLYYDFIHLRAENGTFVVTEWENRLPTPLD